MKYIVLLLISFLCLRQVNAQNDAIALSGVHSFAITTELKGYGDSTILAQALKNKAELEARKVPITITEFQSIEDQTPHLEIDVDAMRKSDNTIICNVRLEFYRVYEIVPLSEPDHPIRIKNVVWERGILLGPSPNEFDSNVKKSVDMLLAEFLNDYLKANPKQNQPSDTKQ